jgi:O-antigen ligase
MVINFVLNVKIQRLILHILAENGIVGFILFLYLFKLMFKIIKKFYYFDKVNYYFLKYGLLAIIISGLTEHRWTTPSEVLPYTIYFSIAVVYLYIKEKK